MNPQKILDPIDVRILKALSRDARITWSELADEVGLSVTPTLRRVRQMEDAGLIRGYHAELDHAQLIGDMAVFISITMEKQASDTLGRLEASVAQLPEIMSGHMLSGAQDFLLLAYVRDLAHYRDLLATLTAIEGIAHVQSSFVLKSFLVRSTPLVLERSQR